jgi:hypothetical protein
MFVMTGPTGLGTGPPAGRFGGAAFFGGAGLEPPSRRFGGALRSTPLPPAGERGPLPGPAGPSIPAAGGPLVSEAAVAARVARAAAAGSAESRRALTRALAGGVPASSVAPESGTSGPEAIWLTEPTPPSPPPPSASTTPTASTIASDALSPPRTLRSNASRSRMGQW